jgi:hypothetical protein
MHIRVIAGNRTTPVALPGYLRRQSLDDTDVAIPIRLRTCCRLHAARCLVGRSILWRFATGRQQQREQA